MAKGIPGEVLVSFESGHYKVVKGTWEGDKIWSHFKKHDGGMVHVNKDKVEYIETAPTEKGHFVTQQKGLCPD